MANETHSGPGSVGYSIPAPADAMVTAEIREAMVSPVFARMVAFNEPGIAKIFPRITTAASVNTLAAGDTEEDVATPTTIVLTNPTATMAVKTAAVRQSKLSIEGAAANWEAEMPAMLGRALAEKMDIDVCDLLGGFSNTVGSTGVDCSLENLRAAHVLLRRTAKGSAEQAVYVLHPQQIGDVEAVLASGAGAGVSQLVSRPDFLSLYGQGAGTGALSAYRGHLFGIPVFQTTNVPDENTIDDHGGALLVPGQAIALLYKWLGRIERGDQAVNLASAITWFASSCYGAVELDDNKGVSIITDHV